MARKVSIKSAADIEMARKAGALAAEVLQVVAEHVRPGVTTDELDRICHDHIVKVQQAIPANIGYHGFPKTICASPNHVICHGIPSSKVLKNGDILNIDVAVIKDGWYGDTSRMYYVGEPSPLARRLVRTTYEAMRAGIMAVKPGATLGDIGHAIQTVAHREYFSIVREYCGHGIGQIYHDEPQVLHYGRPGEGLVLQPGMMFTIEPMINAGKPATRQMPDGWTVVTKDRSLSAQWEHMVVVTDTGYEVLTPWPDGFGDYPPIPRQLPGSASSGVPWRTAAAMMASPPSWPHAATPGRFPSNAPAAIASMPSCLRRSADWPRPTWPPNSPNRSPWPPRRWPPCWRWAPTPPRPAICRPPRPCPSCCCRCPPACWPTACSAGC